MTLGVEGPPLEMDKHYKVVTKEYIAGGKDGYNALTVRTSLWALMWACGRWA